MNLAELHLISSEYGWFIDEWTYLPANVALTAYQLHAFIAGQILIIMFPIWVTIF